MSTESADSPVTTAHAIRVHTHHDQWMPKLSAIWAVTTPPKNRRRRAGRRGRRRARRTPSHAGDDAEAPADEREERTDVGDLGGHGGVPDREQQQDDADDHVGARRRRRCQHDGHRDGTGHADEWVRGCRDHEERCPGSRGGHGATRSRASPGGWLELCHVALLEGPETAGRRRTGSVRIRMTFVECRSRCDVKHFVRIQTNDRQGLPSSLASAWRARAARAGARLIAARRLFTPSLV